jgi:hypothetical protein
LALGLLLVGLLEFRDSTLSSEEDVTRLFELPVLAMVPVMMSGADRLALQRRRRLFFAVATVVVVLASAAALALWKVMRA